MQLSTLRLALTLTVLGLPTVPMTASGLAPGIPAADTTRYVVAGEANEARYRVRE